MVHGLQYKGFPKIPHIPVPITHHWNEGSPYWLTTFRGGMSWGLSIVCDYSSVLWWSMSGVLGIWTELNRTEPNRTEPEGPWCHNLLKKKTPTEPEGPWCHNLLKKKTPTEPEGPWCHTLLKKKTPTEPDGGRYTATCNLLRSGTGGYLQNQIPAQHCEWAPRRQ
jgi:hypothetical protein